jgi:hypothetical protein
MLRRQSVLAFEGGVLANRLAELAHILRRVCNEREQEKDEDERVSTEGTIQRIHGWTDDNVVVAMVCYGMLALAVAVVVLGWFVARH